MHVNGDHEDNRDYQWIENATVVINVRVLQGLGHHTCLGIVELPLDITQCIIVPCESHVFGRHVREFSRN